VISALRSLIFLLGFSICTISVTFVLLFTFPLPFKTRFYISRAWPRFNLWWLRITCGVDSEIIGKENIPDYPVIIMANHQSTWETLVLHDIFPPIVWVLKRELMWIPVFGWGMIMLRPIAINRSKGQNAMEQLLQQGHQRLNQGLNIVIFPEGTRTTPGTKTKYKIGGAMLVAETGAPVVPVAHNAGYFWPRKQMRKRPGTIKMVIGKPIETKGKTARQIHKEVRDWIEKTKTEIGGPDD
jgi:1-acyl-sn-glycerol-3-phosphate acyltransferase